MKLLPTFEINVSFLAKLVYKQFQWKVCPNMMDLLHTLSDPPFHWFKIQM